MNNERVNQFVSISICEASMTTTITIVTIDVFRCHWHRVNVQVNWSSIFLFQSYLNNIFNYTHQRCRMPINRYLNYECEYNVFGVRYSKHFIDFISHFTICSRTDRLHGMFVSKKRYILNFMSSLSREAQGGRMPPTDIILY